MFTPFLFIYVIWFLVIIIGIIKASKNKKKTISSDGHVVPKTQDVTCENEFGHNHPNSSNPEYGRRYIVHEEPEEGYVVLNGIKRKISDCKYL